VASYSVYTNHGASKIITKAFSKGSGWKHIHVQDYCRDGKSILGDGDVAVYGLARGLYPCVQAADNFVFMDHGYLHAGHYAGYYSVTKNGYQHTGEGEYDDSRLPKIDLFPMRYGRHVLLLPPARPLAQILGINVDKWIADHLQIPTERPIRIREKGDPKPLWADLENCHAVVTYNSKAAIDAAIRGISVFTTSVACCATRIAQPLSTIDSPDLHIDRHSWLCALSHNQFTLEEMENGLQMQRIREAA
jgi:hypothetical protein